jgi:hypothetical protein
VDPPKPGEPSYKQYEQETSITHQSLLDRSAYMSERFNALQGMSCQKAEGAMYLFPSIEMPDKAKAEAERRGKEADVMYALDLLGTFWTWGFRSADTDRRLGSRRCHGNLCGRWIRVRSEARDVSFESDRPLPRCGGLCRQDRDVPQGFHEQVRLGSRRSDVGWGRGRRIYVN